MSTSLSNVVAFPKERIVRDESPEDVAQRSKRRQLVFMNGVVEDISRNVLMNLFMSGVDMNQKSVAEKFALTVECLRATLYQSIEVEHYFHKQMESMIEEIRKNSAETLEMPDVEHTDEDDDLTSE